MKIEIRYFSGTGNTAITAAALGKALKELGEISISSIEENIPVGSDTDLLILGGPIYAGNIPEKLIRWLLRNVESNKCSGKAIVFTTSAGLKNAFGNKSMSLKLIKKGYSIYGTAAFEMPRNYYFGSYEKPASDIIKEELKSISEKSADFIRSIDWDSPIKPDSKGILQLDLFAELFSVMARFMGKSYRVDESCIRCGKCVKNCPTRNIRMNENGVKFNLSCMHCTRCLHGCPVNAISYKGIKYEQYKPDEILLKIQENN
ncbi:EFR1 family ferrodoxin [Spirochaeta isovalerica]|uniref:Ferredoxin/flavodoxin n=1 Tax=Spirochaeta isovalerica TaxID=150 RepID=A0A841R8D4_9SPIO|nr:ferredoxin/flavodoxin [Spirochaeta isovalerica]